MKHFKIRFADGEKFYVTSRAIMDAIEGTGIELSTPMCIDWVKRPGKYCNIEANKLLSDMGARKLYNVDTGADNLIEIVKGEGLNDAIMEQLVECGAINYHAVNNSSLQLFSVELAEALAHHMHLKAQQLHKVKPVAYEFKVEDVLGEEIHIDARPTIRTRSVVKAKKKPITHGLIFGRADRKKGREI